VTRFSVWAPSPDMVELAIGSERRPMRRGDGGWWWLEVPDAGPGTDHGYVLDGEGPYPDPRSRWQPEGVHGPSRLVDPAAFRWSDAGWSAPPLADAVIYELHVGTFSQAGTFDGAIGHLDELVDLGITHVELMPVAESPGDRGWGYDGVDLFAAHHAYGGPAGLDRFVDACHARGLAVLLDVVHNHLGPDGNHLPRFGPYLTDRYRTPWGPAMNLDGPGSDEVRAFLIDSAIGWLRDHHVDGLRLDAVHAIHDRSALHFLEELTAAVHGLAAALGRRLVVTAESDLNDPRLVRDPAVGGYGIDAQWNDDFRHALHVSLTGESDRFHAQYTGLPDLVTALRDVFVFAGRYSSYRHRRHGRPVGDLPFDRFIGFLQNHDQVGNRASGERSSALLDPWALRFAAAMVLLGPFVPLLFAGEEWAASTPFLYFTDHRDAGLAAAVRDGRRGEFAPLVPPGTTIPDPQSPETFERSKLIWSERSRGEHRALLDWHRRLIRLRRERPDLRDGRRPDVGWGPEARSIVMRRSGVVVAAVLGPDPVDVPIEDPALRVELASDEAVAVRSGSLHLPGRSVAVLVRV
jgi:maltooligosyltrehalose trehalohydrolase